MSEARRAILARIGSALGPDPAVPEVPRDYRPTGAGTGTGTGTATAEDLIERFVERLADHGGAVHASIADAIAARGIERLACAPGLRPDASGVRLVFDDPPLSAADIEALDGALTGCALAIAETGTIVLDGSPACGRRALTLIPDYHLCVVQTSQIVAGVPDAVAALAPAAVAGRPITMISGPSATSDIELDRVEGVHGPRRLDVVLL